MSSSSSPGDHVPHPKPERATNLATFLATVLKPAPANYDDYGPDGLPVWMTPKQKAADRRVSAAEDHQAEAEASDPHERDFYRQQAERSTVQAVAIERRVIGQARRQPIGRPRARGAGRPGHRRVAGARAGPDSDSDSDGPKTRVATGPRCAAPWCDRPVYGASQKTFCGTERCNQARAAERQRKRRSADLTTQERERLLDARLAGYVGADAFAGPEKHALSFLWKHELVDGFDPGEYEALLNRPACRCNGHHIDGGAVGCFKCGLSREEVAA